ncbi:MAG: DUF4835 family protein [Flavobacteriaceae bacterium]
MSFGLWSNAQGIESVVRVINRTQNRSFEANYRTLERDLTRLINQTQWDSTVGISRKPKVSLNMTLSVVDHSDQTFKTMLLVELFKIHGSGDKVLLFRWVEQPLVFSYVPFEPLIFNKNNLSSNLVAHAAFFAYLALGFNEDTEKLMGGTPFYRQAEDIVVRMQSTSNSGWEMRRSGSSKYRLIYELLQKPYYPAREFLFDLHTGCLASGQRHTDQYTECLLHITRQLKETDIGLDNSLLMQRIQESNRAIFD